MKCAVANCKSRNVSKACNISFFVFPTNYVLKKKWVSFCRREKKFNPQNSYICMLHFKPEDIANGLQYEMGFARHRLLKRNVVPTIKTDSIGKVELSDQRTSRIKKRENKQIVNSLLKKSYADDAAQRLQDVELNKVEDGNPVCYDTSESVSFMMSHEHAYANHNVLNWHQRMEAIREYDTQNPKPTVEQLAMKYNVTEALMKNILDNREFVLKSYEEELVVKRQRKIDLLDKVMYEFVQRALYCNLSLDDEQMLQKAQEVRDGIDIANFEPTILWLKDFKLTYGITGFDKKTLCEAIKPWEAKRHQLTACDMIAHVILLEKKEENKKRKLTEQERGNNIAKVLVETSVKSSQPAAMPENGNGLIVKNEKEDTDDAKTIVTNVVNCPQNTIVAHANAAANSMFEIKSLKEALEHLRLLEEFAMLQENYRAIGLLTHLEQLFKQSSKDEVCCKIIN